MGATSYSNVRRFIAYQTGFVLYFFCSCIYSINTFNRYEPSLLLYCPSLNCVVEWHHSCCMCFRMVELS